jgi:hypothetical protein
MKDIVISVITLIFLPSMFLRSPDWFLTTLYFVVYMLKALHLYLLFNPCRSNGAGIHNFTVRNGLIITERILRIAASVIDNDSGKHMSLQIGALAGTTPSNFKMAVEVSKRLFWGTGSTVMLWHTFCLPTVWGLEGVLLLPLTLLALWTRAPIIAAFLARYPPSSGVFVLKQRMAATFSSACKAAILANHSENSVCSMASGSGLELDLHLMATLLIFVQYLLPLYVR